MSNKSTRPDLIHNGKMTKVERYGWRLLDKPGVFMMIPKESLRINHADYQRQQVASKVQRIAADWSWMACLALGVALREGEFWVFDGGHRKMAADVRSDIEVLPCMVFEAETVADEARAFSLSNVNRKPISAVDRMRAQSVSGDEMAMKVEALARQAGRRIARDSSAATINCVAAIERCLRLDEETLVRVWPTIVVMSHDAVMHRDLIEGLWYCERNLIAGQSLLSDPWRSRLKKAGAARLLDHMRQAKIFHGKAGDRMLGLGVLAAINRHARTDIAAFRQADVSA
jgi:hypothetical protein